MQSSSTLIKISGPFPEVKKIITDQRFRKYFEYWKESEQSEVLANKLGLFQIQLGGSERKHNPSRHNCYIDKNVFFLENWQFNHKLGPPFSPTNSA